MGGYKVIHPDSRADLGSSHHFMHNGEEIKILVMGGYKVIHPDSRVDLGSSHHFMHNGEEIKLVSPKVDEKSMCEGNAYV